MSDAVSAPNPGPIRRFVESSGFRNFITILIVLNAITLGAATYNLPTSLDRALDVFDRAVTGIFVIEILLKLLVYRFSFFKSGWNLFDFTVVAISLIPGARGLQVLRALRVLRILRLLHVVPMLRRIVEALFKALPGMGAIMAVLALITYVGAVMATTMFGRTDNEDVLALFGTLQDSAFTLFQVMTMDGWRNEVVQVVMDDGHPYAWVFFLIFIFMASFAILNLFIALIVEALQQEQEALMEEEMELLETGQAESERRDEAMMAMVADLQAEIRSLKETLRDTAPK